MSYGMQIKHSQLIHPFITWPAPRAGKMNQILYCDWQDLSGQDIPLINQESGHYREISDRGLDVLTE